MSIGSQLLGAIPGGTPALVRFAVGQVFGFVRNRIGRRRFNRAIESAQELIGQADGQFGTGAERLTWVVEQLSDVFGGDTKKLVMLVESLSPDRAVPSFSPENGDEEEVSVIRMLLQCAVSHGHHELAKTAALTFGLVEPAPLEEDEGVER